MSALIIAHYILAPAIIVASGFDVDSTNRAIKAGAYEANPLMAWFQAKLGRLWWIARIGLGLIPATVGALMPVPYGPIALFAIICVYAVVIAQNYGHWSSLTRSCGSYLGLTSSR